MTFDPSALVESTLNPPRILLYGFPGTGKTTFASQFNTPLFLDLERGIPPHVHNTVITYTPTGISDKQNQDARNVKYFQVIEFLTWVSTADHGYETFVIDSLDRLEEIITDQVLVENGWKYVNEPGFGKGQDAVFRSYREVMALIDKINQRGMTTIMIAHAGTIKIEHPVYPSYDKISLLLMKKACAWFIENSDIIGYCNLKTFISTEKIDRNTTKNKAMSSGERILTTGPSATLETKNRRYEKLPSDIPLNYKTYQQYTSDLSYTKIKSA
jgi:hypothetical protein